MALSDTWTDGQTVHGSDLNDFADAIIEVEADIGASLLLSQPTGQLCTLPRAQQIDVTLTSGELNLTYFQSPIDLTASHVGIVSGSTAGVGVTLAKLGLYSVDSSGNLTLIGSTANTTSLFAASYTPYETALAASTELARGSVYAFGLVVTATTMPTLNGAFVIDDANLPPRLCGALESQTDLPASIAVGDVGDNFRVLYARFF